MHRKYNMQNRTDTYRPSRQNYNNRQSKSKFHGKKRNRGRNPDRSRQYTQIFIFSLKEDNKEKPKNLLHISVPKFYPKKPNNNNNNHDNHNRPPRHTIKKGGERNWDHMEMIRSFEISENSFTKRSKLEDMEEEERFFNEFRNLFNKVSEDTFVGIRQEISNIPCDTLDLNDPEFLKKTSKILIEKAVIDHTFIDLYVTLMMDIYNKLFQHSTQFLDEIVLYCTHYFYPIDTPDKMELKEIRKFKYIGCLNFMTHTILVDQLDESSSWIVEIC